MDGQLLRDLKPNGDAATGRWRRGFAAQQRQPALLELNGRTAECCDDGRQQLFPLGGALLADGDDGTAGDKERLHAIDIHGCSERCWTLPTSLEGLATHAGRIKALQRLI